MPIRTIFPVARRGYALPLLAAPLALALGGCVSFGAKAPPQLLTISPDATISSDTTINSAGLPSLALALPDVPRKLSTTRVPVQVSATSVAYVKDAQWTDAPRDLFRRLLGETLSADGLFLVDEEHYGPRPQKRLSGLLLDFGIDAQSKQAVVTFDATLADNNSGAAVRRRFTAHAPLSDIKAGKVADPINRAANQVAKDIAAWVKSN